MVLVVLVEVVDDVEVLVDVLVVLLVVVLPTVVEVLVVAGTVQPVEVRYCAIAAWVAGSEVDR